MAFNLASGMGAGAGADMLQQILKQKALEFAQAEARKQEDARIAIERQRANSEDELKRIAMEDRQMAQAGAAKAQAQTGAAKLMGTLRPKDEVTPSQSAAITAGGFGDKLVAPTLGSRNFGAGMSSTPNPGRGESFTGLPDQLDEQAQTAELDRQIALASPQRRGRLQMARVLPTDKRSSVIAEVMREEAKPTSKPVMRLNSRTGQMEQMGTAPVDAHFVNEPAPKDTSASDAARAQQSYQYHASALEKLRKPVEDTSAKIADLNDILAQGTPQADALVAPKLLSTLVGGQGSGLRMNEAEISRIVGGRSKWESLRAAAQAWSLDPATASSITPEQRTQIHALVSAASKKNADALAVLDDAGGALSTASDPMQHRKILNDTHKRLSSLATGGGTPAAAPKVIRYDMNGNVIKD